MASQEAANQDQAVDPSIDVRLQTQNIGDTLARLADGSTFARLVHEAEMGQMLRLSGLRTLLAPTNEALQGIQPDDVEAFVQNHLLPGGQETFDLRRCREVKNIAGAVLPIKQENGSIRIGKALITRSDIPCTNGVIQIVNAAVAD